MRYLFTALLFSFSFSFASETQSSDLTVDCYTSQAESASFVLPSLPARVPDSMLVGVRLEGLEVGFGLQYGMENVTGEDVGVVLTRRYIANDLWVGNTLIASPSLTQQGYSDWIGPFDGLIDAPHPDGASGYWGGTPPTEFTYQPQRVWTYASVDWKSPVVVDFRPRGSWEYLDGAPSGSHWAVWRDEMHARVIDIAAVVYELDRNGDGLADMELAYPVD
jgi:hypothetical protein